MRRRNLPFRRPLQAAFAAMAASLLSASLVMAASPPINCRKVARSADREVCASSEFLAMDREIAALYDRGMTRLTGADRHKLVLGQQAFLRQRTGCDWAAHHSAHPGVAVEECVRASMETRISSLRQVVDRGRF